ncbi:MAG: ABC transporter ATP-binding protein [Ignavibacteriae bacterium]|nr:ABC transporter ATP-binding protein [Ignavibacteriota bacterium]
MYSVLLQISQLSKVFNRRTIFSDINFSLQESNSLTVTGINGSGKSTLLKIIAGVLSPTHGHVSLSISDKQIDSKDRFQQIGFVAPYLQLYDEFTAWENLAIVRKIRGMNIDDGYLISLLRRMSLEERKDELVRTYSSGMKQRLKYAFALLHQPPILILDEPTTNLDESGHEIIYDIIEEQKQSGVVIIATNDSHEVRLCEQVLDLDKTGRYEVNKVLA